MDYKNYNDYELIYMVRENSSDSKDILYRKYQPVIKSIAREFYKNFKYYGYEYEDFLQEAEFFFEKAIVQYDDNKGMLFYSFVDLCVRRGLINFCRNISNDKKNRPLYCYIDIGECNIPDINNDVNNFINECDLHKLINKLKFKLSLNDSSILELRLNGFSYREIAILLSTTSSYVEYRIRKIRKEFAKYYCKETI